MEIRPFRNGWKCFEAPGVEPVFLNQEHAIDYATGRACFRPGEIRILDSTSTYSTRSSPPQSTGSESKIVSESVHGCPHGSRNAHWRSPYSDPRVQRVHEHRLPWRVERVRRSP